MSKIMNKELEEQKLKIRQYLNSENVSILAGAGTSWHLGAPVIRELPKDLIELVNGYFSKDTTPSFEGLFNCLQADRFLKEQKAEDTSQSNKAITKMQTWLFENCNTEKTRLNIKDDKQLQKNRYYYHESFIKKLLQRPNNLKRSNLFTTNYDMAFDYALDNLGVHYINGFMGVHNRCFRPEVYDYDLYYPGESVEGKVHRAEKVLKYYKLHGSLSWLETKPDSSNTYGIKEIPLHKGFTVEENKKLIIYPCTTKKSFTLDLPYSELFRQFSQAIIQPQSVLFCIGYSFYDEHINDIIKQALTIPSFTLIIINYQQNNNHTQKDNHTQEDNDTQEVNPIEAFKKLAKFDKRIIVLKKEKDEKEEGVTFLEFVKNIMPDLYEEEETEKIAKTMQHLYPDKKGNNNDGE